MAGKIIADTIQAAGSYITLNVGNVTILTANSTGLTITPSSNLNFNVTNSIWTASPGSNSAPSLTFSGNTSTGIFFPSTNTVAISTAATERIRIDSSGAVGIGTNSPGTLGTFEVQATGGNFVGLAIKNNATGSVLYGGSYTNISMASESANFQITQVGGSGYLYGGAASVNFIQGSNAPMTFSTNSLERMRIDSSGNLLVTTTSQINPNSGTQAGINLNAIGQIVGSVNSDTNYFRRTGTDGNLMVFYKVNSAVGGISVTASATAYATSSDYRLKENIMPMTGGLAKVSALKPVIYTWKSNQSEGQGFIAHELAEVVPQCVIGEKDAVDADGNPQYQGIDTSFLVATLTAAIQELKVIVDAQAVEISALKAK
jgi:Chaperone of endosialidase